MKTEDQRVSGKTALQCVVVICVVAYLTTFVYQGPNLGAITHVSTWIALCSLSGFWVGLGKFPLRIPIAAAVVVVTALVSSGLESQALVCFLFSLGMVFVVAGTSFAVRLLFGELRQTGELNAENEALQFSVRDILLWTTAIAGMLAVGRWLASIQGNTGMEGIFMVGGIIGTLVVTCIVAVWAFLGNKLSPSRIIAYLLVLAVAAMLNETIENNSYGFWLVTTVASQIPVVAAIYCLRLQDYRFVRAGFE